MARHINLDREDDRIKNFIRALPVGADGALLELDGAVLLRVLPVADKPIDAGKLKAAILRRRDESRLLNAEWEAVDQETWNPDGRQSK